MQRVGKTLIFLTLSFSCLRSLVPGVINPQQVVSDRLHRQHELFLVFDPKNLSHRFSIMYAQALWKRFKMFNLSVFGISTGNRQDTEEAKQLCRVSFPVIQDGGIKFIEKHNLNGRCGATMLVSPDQEILFKESELLPPELLRQLIERHLNMVEMRAEPPVWSPPFIEREIIPDFMIYEIDGQRRTLSEELKKLNILTFFSSYSSCLSCKHVSRLETLRKISTNAGDGPFLGVFFMEPFSVDDVKMIRTSQGWNFPTYLIQNFMSEENIFITEERLKCDPWSVLIDDNRVVIWSEYPGFSEERIIKEINQRISKLKTKLK